MSNNSNGKAIARTTTPLSNNTVVLAAIEHIHDPESASVNELTIEERVRLAWQHFRAYEMELGRQRKSEARRGKTGLPVTSKRGKSSAYIAQRVGMKQTSFQSAQLVVELADELRARGQQQEAARLLHLLNNVSVNAAKTERKRLLQLLEDESEIQKEVTASL